MIEDNHKTTVCQASSSKYPLTGVSQTHAGALVGNTIISCGGGSSPVTPSCYRQIIFINTPKKWARFKDSRHCSASLWNSTTATMLQWRAIQTALLPVYDVKWGHFVREKMTLKMLPAS